MLAQCSCFYICLVILLLTITLHHAQHLFEGSEHPNDYVVAVIFKGKPTHHLAVKTAQGMKINNKPTPAKNIGQLVTLLRKKHPFWPVPIDEYVKKGGTGTGKLSAAPSRKSSSKSAPKADSGGGDDDADDDDGGSGGDPEWLFGPMGKPAAESKLTDAGMDKLGNFMVRARGPENPGDYVICVIYKGKPTHHYCNEHGHHNPDLDHLDHHVNNNLGGM